MDTNKTKSLIELIESFDTGYYKEKIDNIEKEINNIKMGRPRFDGIESFDSGEVVPQHKVDKEISKLTKELQDNEKIQKDLSLALSELRTFSANLKDLAEKEVLLSNLKYILASERSVETKKTDIFKENKNKYHKLYLKSNKKMKQPTQKISKEIYKLIKKNLGKRAYESLDNYWSIRTALKDNKIQIKSGGDVAQKIFSDTRTEYGHLSYSDDIGALGVNVLRVNNAIKQTEGEVNSYSLTFHGKYAFENLKNIKLAEKINIETKGGYSKLLSLKEKYTEIVELSRETWFINEIIESFSNTSIVNTDMYKGMQELIRQQELEMSKLIRDVDKLYDKTGLQNKVNLIERLEELYQQTQQLKAKIEEYNNLNNKGQVEYYEQEYSKLRYEMIKILRDNPDLDNPKYNIDIKNIINKEMELFEPEIKKEIKNIETIEPIEKTMPINNQPVNNIENKEIVEENTFRTEEGYPHIEEPKQEKTDINELKLLASIYRNDYITERINKTELGQLDFSKYLEKVAPQHKELIEYIKTQENYTRTIYAEYLRDLVVRRENGYKEVSFKDFVRIQYKVEDYYDLEIPLEIENELKGAKSL